MSTIPRQSTEQIIKTYLYLLKLWNHTKRWAANFNIYIKTKGPEPPLYPTINFLFVTWLESLNFRESNCALNSISPSLFCNFIIQNHLHLYGSGICWYGHHTCVDPWNYQYHVCKSFPKVTELACKLNEWDIMWPMNNSNAWMDQNDDVSVFVNHRRRRRRRRRRQWQPRSTWFAARHHQLMRFCFSLFFLIFSLAFACTNYFTCRTTFRYARINWGLKKLCTSSIRNWNLSLRRWWLLFLTNRTTFIFRIFVLFHLPSFHKYSLFL